jgi:cell wall-associated NlpC family hydrolase
MHMERRASDLEPERRPTGLKPGSRSEGLTPGLHNRGVLVMLALLAAIAASSCAASGARPRPFPTPHGVADDPSDESAAATDIPIAHPDGYAIASAALRLQGIPYRSGGSDRRGFDCSGLVQYVLAQYGLSVPRLVRDQYVVGTRIKLDDLEPGDLVFFTTEGRQVSHVGIAIGGDRFVHAPNSRGSVRVDSLATGYWGERITGAKRMTRDP